MAQDLVKLKVAVTPETAEDIEKLLREQRWDPAEGLRILIGMGLGAVRGERARMDADAQARMVARLMEVEGSLAVLRSRMFETQKADKSWELSIGAIHNQNLGYQGIIDRLREELEILRSENERLLTEIHDLRAGYSSTPLQPRFEKRSVRSKPGCLWDWMRRK